MKILLVTDQYYAANNGLTISARRFCSVLRAHGHDVRVLSYGTGENVAAGENAYLLDVLKVPFFDKLITSQGMTFAKPDDSVIREAVAWADVIHFLSPFSLSHHGIMEARRQNVPYTAAFHVQPENITSSIHIGNVTFINDCIYKWFNHYIYKYCNHVHCPSAFIAGELKKHGYTCMLHVISNGIDPDFTLERAGRNQPSDGKFRILMIGRYSIEKRQDLLIDAAAKSKYADKIEVILAGKGPRLEKLRKRAEKLRNPIRMGFFPKDELIKLISQCDLYVHAADAEIEAMSCMEAFACGLVPVISDSKKSATPQFALDDRSLFAAGNSDDLAKKIDYWYEHPEERAEMGVKYAQSAGKYSLDECVRKAEDMFTLAVREAGRAAILEPAADD